MNELTILQSFKCAVNLDQYPISTNQTCLDFEFESVGPKGTIRKVVRYSPQNAVGTTYFNLGFGDWDEETKKIDDTVVSHNLDRDKILATVAATVLRLTEYYPDIPVYAQGTNPARTRLYQMGIAANWQAIETNLDVYGFYNGK